MTKRILVVTPWKRRWEMGGGAGLADDYYFIRGFIARGYEVHYLSPRYRGADIAMDGYFVHDFPDFFLATEDWPTLLKRPLWPLVFTAWTLARGFPLLRRFPPSAVLSQTPNGALTVFLLGLFAGVPSIVKLFGVVELDRTDWPKWQYLRKNFEQVAAFKVPQDAWFILDDGTRGATAAERHGVPRERIFELPNGVNVEWGARMPDRGARARFQVPADVAVVLLITRLTGWKRPDALIRAVPRILAGLRRQALFLIAGDGPLRAPCEALASRLGVRDSVRFLGPVAHAEVPDLLSLATVLVSTNERSNRGIPVCEAMVCGVPAVVFDTGDTRSVVRDGENGRVVPDGDLDAFADAVADLVNDDARRSALGGRARAFAREHFTGWPERVAMEVDIVERLVERRRASDRT